jgi:hypothetical protein
LDSGAERGGYPLRFPERRPPMNNAQIDFVLQVEDTFDAAVPEDHGYDVFCELFDAIAKKRDIEIARIAREMIEELHREDLAVIWKEHFALMFAPVRSDRE